MEWQRLLLDDADVRYDPHWLGADEAGAMFAALHDGIAWERHRIRLFGREVEAPRWSCWLGDADAVYTYSRTRFEPRPWPDALRAVRERLRAQCGVDFNGVLANLYRDGADSMGWHADDEPEIDPRSPIASLSLPRRDAFTLRHRRDRYAAIGHRARTRQPAAGWPATCSVTGSTRCRRPPRRSGRASTSRSGGSRWRRVAESAKAAQCAVQ